MVTLDFTKVLKVCNYIYRVSKQTLLSTFRGVLGIYDVTSTPAHISADSTWSKDSKMGWNISVSQNSSEIDQFSLRQLITEFHELTNIFIFLQCYDFTNHLYIAPSQHGLWPIEMLHPILKTWEKGNQCRWWLKISKLSWRFKKIPEVFCFTHYFCLTARNPKFILAPSKSYRSGQNLPPEMFHPILKSLDQAESNSTW